MELKACGVGLYVVVLDTAFPRTAAVADQHLVGGKVAKAHFAAARPL
jgi:hypothetical protein